MCINIYEIIYKTLTGLVLQEVWSNESLIDNNRSVVLDRSHAVDKKHALYEKKTETKINVLNTF